MSDFHADDHPHIIKMPNGPPVSEYGLGYEIYHSMKRNSKKIAQYIVETGESQTYSEFLEECVRVAINLKAENLSDDDIVGICIDNHKYTCVPYIASMFIGNKILPLDTQMIPEEKSNLLLTVTPKIIFVDENALQNLEESLKIANLNIKLIVLGTSSSHGSFADFLEARREDVVNFQPIKLKSNKGTAIIFSGSGSSGATRGICISHHTLLSKTEGDAFPSFLIFSQLYWISYNLAALRSIRLGTRRIIMKDFEARNVWKVIENYKVFALFGTVFQIAELAKSLEPEDMNLSCLKLIMTGGTSLPADIFLKLSRLLPGVAIFSGYGLTEIGGLALCYNLGQAEDRKLQLEKPSSCGRPFDGIWYKVVDPNTEEILGPYKQGELRLKSNSMMVGYHEMDSSEAYDAEGWLKTGDIFEYDEDRCFFMIERMKEMIKFRNWTISPTPIEHILMQHPKVDKAAVIGVPHAEDDDFLLGIVTLREKCEGNPIEIEEFVNQRVIDRQKLRGGVKIIPEMPLTSSGKILKRILRRMVKNGEL